MSRFPERGKVMRSIRILLALLLTVCMVLSTQIASMGADSSTKQNSVEQEKTVGDGEDAKVSAVLNVADRYNQSKALQGAKFSLYHYTFDESNQVKGSDLIGAKAAFQSDAAGKVTFSNLNAYDLYYFTQEAAPDGYVYADTGLADGFFVVYPADENAETETQNQAKAQAVAAVAKSAIASPHTSQIDVIVLKNLSSWSMKYVQPIEFKGTKTLNGRDADLDEEFVITLTANDSANPMPAASENVTVNGQTATVKVTGCMDGEAVAFSFGGIVFDKAGNFSYTVKETAGSAADITYDTTEYPVLVTVTTKDNGDLDAKITVNGADVGTAVSGLAFVNTYSQGPEPVTVLLGGTNTLEGIADSDEEFEFVLEENDGIIDTATTLGGGEYTFSPLYYTAAGVHSYKVYERKGSQSGYEYSSETYDVTVTVTAKQEGGFDVEVAGANADGTGLDFTNLCKIVKVLRVDPESGAPLEGAQLRVLDADDKEVESWESGADAHALYNLTTDEFYVLEETEAPADHTKAARISFSIDGHGVVTATCDTDVDENGTTILLVKDEVITGKSVKISKVDKSGAQLAGASLQVLDSEDNTVDDWESEAEVHVVDGLAAGEQYKIIESDPPEGYVAAMEGTFSIDENGAVTYSGNTTTDAEGDTVLLVENEQTCIRIQKQDMITGSGLAGAKMQILDSRGDTVESWTTDTAQHAVYGLIVGAEYTLREATAPVGYGRVTDTKFVIDGDGEITTEGTTGTDDAGLTQLVIEDEPIRFAITKVAAETNESLAGATFEIYQMTASDRIVSEDGKTPKVYDSWVSKKGESHDFGPKLEAGKRYLLVETKVPSGYKRAASVIVTVSESGSVSVNLKSKKDKDGELVYLVSNAADTKTTATPTPTKRPTATPTRRPTVTRYVTRRATVTPRRTTITPTRTPTGTRSRTTAANTGDESPVELYLLLAAVAIAAIMIMRRRKRM